MTRGRSAQDELEAFVEEAAVVYGELGFPKMAGRIMGWLLVCDPPWQTQAELARVLKASKGSISTMIRVLVRVGVARRLSLPGDRHEYVALRGEPSPEERRLHERRFALLRELAQRGLEALGAEAGERAKRLVQLRDLNVFLERELPALFDRFRDEQQKRSKRRG